MRIALCQLNPTVGNVDANADAVVEWAERAAAAGADLALFPELVLSGYPAEDLWLKPHFVARCEAALERLAARLPLPCVVGCPIAVVDGTSNAAAYIQDGQVCGTYAKQLLPNYAVFDEHRWFAAGTQPLVVEVPVPGGRPVAVAITICEDGWVADGPAMQAAAAGAEVVVNLSASPWRVGRATDREAVVVDRARETGCWIALCNQVGGQDELVFDGHSLVAAPDGTVVARGVQFAPDMVVTEVGPDAPVAAAPAEELQPVEREVWEGLVLGLRDYVRKNGFESVVLGLSGGIDSALVLALAVDALGAGHVHAATMPSRFSSEGTRCDAHDQAARLGVTINELAIQPIVDGFESTLAPAFAGTVRDVTEENLQARVRGTLLMALSNKFGHLLLATGNKSEGSVGYATLYGDMNGGFAPIKDLYKQRVYELARWRNEHAAAAGEPPVIPPSVIERAPSAELAPDQRDEDSLGDYARLDAILRLLVDEDLGVEDVVRRGFDEDHVTRVQRMLDRAEYKRRQGAPGTRVSAKAFGRDRRMPITNGFDGRVEPAVSPAR
jgi:NAD+ synthase (glutamine-hydrolysing)